MVQRSGRVAAVTVRKAKAKFLMPHLRKRVLPASVVYTDELRSCDSLKRAGYQQRRIYHAEQIYVSGTIHTNSTAAPARPPTIAPATPPRAPRVATAPPASRVAIAASVSGMRAHLECLDLSLWIVFVTARPSVWLIQVYCILFYIDIVMILHGDCVTAARNAGSLYSGGIVTLCKVASLL